MRSPLSSSLSVNSKDDPVPAGRVGVGGRLSGCGTGSALVDLILARRSERSKNKNVGFY